MLKPVHIRQARERDFEAMTEVWYRAVKPTHSFLTDSDIEGYRARIPTEVFPAVPEIWAATGEDDEILGFIGMDGDEVGMLFVDSEHQAQGVGTALVDLVTEGRPVLEVEVNEQASQAVAFYQKVGFEETSRSPLDGDGNPFPLLRMKRQGVDSV